MQSTDASQVMLGEQARVQFEAVLVSALFHSLAADHNVLNLAGASDEEVQALLVTMQSVREDSLRRRAQRKAWEARCEAWRVRCEAWRAQREDWQVQREAWRVRREVWRETRRVRRAEARARLLAHTRHATLAAPPSKGARPGRVHRVLAPRHARGRQAPAGPVAPPPGVLVQPAHRQS